MLFCMKKFLFMFILIVVINVCNVGFLEVIIMFLFFLGDDVRGDWLWVRLVIVMMLLLGDDYV